jgi:AcrR family transcriptional regulator
MAKSPQGEPRTRDAARTQSELIAVATEEFARLGYFGARVDDIAARSATTKRMIYYYFGDKEGLFAAVLEQAYAGIRAAELALDLGHLPPMEGLAVLVRHTFEYHDANPHLARLISAENGQEAVHLRANPRQASLNLPVIELIDDLLRRGRATGVVRRDVSAIDLHLMMVGLALYRITNAATVDATFGLRIDSSDFKERQIHLLTEMLQTWLQAPEEVVAKAG